MRIYGVVIIREVIAAQPLTYEEYTRYRARERVGRGEIERGEIERTRERESEEERGRKRERGIKKNQVKSDENCHLKPNYGRFSNQFHSYETHLSLTNEMSRNQNLENFSYVS